MRRYSHRALAATCSAIALAALIAGAPSPAFADAEADALAELQTAVEQEQSGAADLQEAVDAVEENPTAETIATATSTAQGYGVNLGSLSSGTSAQYLFAQLQLELATQNKNAALDKITQVSNEQSQQKALADLINELATLASAARKTGEAQPISSELLSRLDELGIEYGKDVAKKKAANKEELDAIILNAQSRQEALGGSIQQEMVYIQDYMGQYNSYLQRASSATAGARDTLAALARGTVDSSDDSLLMQNYLELANEQAEQLDQRQTTLEEQMRAFLENPSPEAQLQLEREIDQYHIALESMTSITQSLTDAEKSLATRRGTVSTDGTGNLAPLALGGVSGIVIGAVGALAIGRRRNQTAPSAASVAANNAESE